MSGKKPLRNRVETVSASLSNCVFVLMIDFMIICLCMYCMCFTGIETVPPDLLSVTGSCIKLRMTQQPPLNCIRSSKDPSVSFLTNFYSVHIVLTSLSITLVHSEHTLSLNFTDDSANICGSLYVMVQSACGLQHPSSKCQNARYL